ncbi:MAG: hypothetical protein MUE33_11620 [Cytophagaceae bacterium]|jgi:hypothetical protein|nr:hypothetical protein [Cytophagaceae bacterium]
MAREKEINKKPTKLLIIFMDIDYASFLKFGNKNHLEKLLNEGVIYCKPIEYFTKIETIDLRGDKLEGLAYIQNIKNIKLKLNEKTIANAPTGKLNMRHPKDKGNIFCLFGLPTKKLNLTLKTVQKLSLNLEGVRFGDYALLIFNPNEFIRRVDEALNKRDLAYTFSPVTYYNYKIFEGELTPFSKSDIYAAQSEVRLWIPNEKNNDLIIQIGNISDISRLLSIDELDKLEYEAI